MTTTVIDLHGRRGDPTADPDLNPNITYISRYQFWGPGRVLHPHPLRNPHLVDKPCPTCRRTVHTRDQAVALYCWHLLDRPDLFALIPPLSGRTLACWCHPVLCHGHIVAALAENPSLDLLRTLAADPTAALDQIDNARKATT